MHMYSFYICILERGFLVGGKCSRYSNSDLACGKRTYPIMIPIQKYTIWLIIFGQHGVAVATPSQPLVKSPNNKKYYSLN